MEDKGGQAKGAQAKETQAKEAQAKEAQAKEAQAKKALAKWFRSNRARTYGMHNWSTYMIFFFGNQLNYLYQSVFISGNLWGKYRSFERIYYNSTSGAGRERGTSTRNGQIVSTFGTRRRRLECSKFYLPKFFQYFISRLFFGQLN